MPEETRTELEKREIPPPIHHVDGHNLALPFWLEAANRNNGIRSLLVHIDAHDDMFGRAPTIERAKTEKPWLDLNSYDGVYAENCLSVANHTIVGCFKGAIGSVVWFDPRREEAGIFGSFDTNEHPPIKMINGNLYWETGILPTILCEPVEETLVKMQKSKLPIILDIDLDAFLCVTDPLEQQRNNQTITDRLKFVDNLLRFVPKENIKAITVARSQTPSRWVPEDKVDLLSTLTVDLLRQHDLIAA